MNYYKVCRVTCTHCGDVLEQRHQRKDERGCLFFCRCGKVGLDPAADGYRVLGAPNDYIDHSEPWEGE